MSEPECPYPGLRPFRRDESYLFFGRETQTDELLRRLASTRFLAIVGPSGCGKSSLVRAGLIPALESGLMMPAGPRWRFAVARPGNMPALNLADALIDQVGLVIPELGREDRRGFLSATLARGPLGLVEALNETPLPGDTNLLVVIDQFEEIFRFHGRGAADEAEAFVALLLESARQTALPIYITITMRSDFIGNCAIFNGLADAINAGQFLTPRLSREQRRAAIEGPARVLGGDVAPEVVSLLLNDAARSPDDLPVLQHLLMRMWMWRPSINEGKEAGEGRVLKLDDYHAVGGLEHALSTHLDTTFDKLSERGRDVVEIAFRRLTECGGNQTDLRRPTRAGEIAAVAGVDLPTLTSMLDLFRVQDCNFITPLLPEEITSDTMIDIGHESLIRLWDRLRGWASVEAEFADFYRFLDQSANRWREGQAALWGTPNLEMGVDWRARARPTRIWADRYGGDFDNALAFLGESERVASEAAAADEARRHRQIRHLRLMVGGLALLSLILAGGALWVWEAYVAEHPTYYKEFVKQWGIPEGVYPLTDEQVRHRAVSFRIVRQGRRGPVIRMEAVDGRGRCTPNHSVGTYLEKSEDRKQNIRKECSWEFLLHHDCLGWKRAFGRCREENQVIYEMAYDRNRRLVWGMAYAPRSPEAPKDKVVRTAYFVGADGFPRPLKNSSAELVKIEYTDGGLEHRQLYLDRSLRPQPGRDSAYGIEFEYYPNGTRKRMISLGKDHETWINDIVGNAIFEMRRDETGNVIEMMGLDSDEKPVLYKEDKFSSLSAVYDIYGNATEYTLYDAHGKVTYSNDGCVTLKIKYDENGNGVKYTTYDENGSVAINKYGYAITRYTYDDNGFVTSVAYFGPDDQPITTDGGYASVRMQRDDRGNIEQWSYLDINERPTRLADGSSVNRCWFDKNDNCEVFLYLDENQRPVLNSDGYSVRKCLYGPRNEETECSYLDTNGKITLRKDGYAIVKYQYDKRGNIVREDYLDENGQLISGIATYEMVRDDRKNTTEMRYFDANHAPIQGADGYASVKYKYDSRDNKIEESYFDENGGAATLSDGYSVVRMTYDDRDRETSWSYFDGNRRPVNYMGAYHLKRIDYLDNYMSRDEYFFDANGSPALEPVGGCEIESAEANWRGQFKKVACYGPNKEPRSTKAGYHAKTTVYDQFGRSIEESYYDPDGNLTIPIGAYCAKTTYQYRRTGSVSEKVEYDPDGAQTVTKYDARGREIEIDYLTRDGRPKKGKNGYAHGTVKYDDDHNIVEMSYFDENGDPTPSTGGITREILVRDADGNLVDDIYFDRNGTLHREGIVHITAIIPQGKAEELGLRAGDRIVEYNGGKVTSIVALQRWQMEGGADERDLVIERDGEEIHLVVPAGRPGIELEMMLETESSAEANGQ